MFLEDIIDNDDNMFGPGPKAKAAAELSKQIKAFSDQRDIFAAQGQNTELYDAVIPRIQTLLKTLIEHGIVEASRMWYELFYKNAYNATDIIDTDIADAGLHIAAAVERKTGVNFRLKNQEQLDEVEDDLFAERWYTDTQVQKMIIQFFRAKDMSHLATDMSLSWVNLVSDPNDVSKKEMLDINNEWAIEQELPFRFKDFKFSLEDGGEVQWTLTGGVPKINESDDDMFAASERTSKIPSVIIVGHEEFLTQKKIKQSIIDYCREHGLKILGTHKDAYLLEIYIRTTRPEDLLDLIEPLERLANRQDMNVTMINGGWDLINKRPYDRITENDDLFAGVTTNTVLNWYRKLESVCDDSDTPYDVDELLRSRSAAWGKIYYSIQGDDYPADIIAKANDQQRIQIINDIKSIIEDIQDSINESDDMFAPSKFSKWAQTVKEVLDDLYAEEERNLQVNMEPKHVRVTYALMDEYDFLRRELKRAGIQAFVNGLDMVDQYAINSIDAELSRKKVQLVDIEKALCPEKFNESEDDMFAPKQTLYPAVKALTEVLEEMLEMAEENPDPWPTEEEINQYRAMLDALRRNDLNQALSHVDTLEMSSLEDIDNGLLDRGINFTDLLDRLGIDEGADDDMFAPSQAERVGIALQKLANEFRQYQHSEQSEYYCRKLGNIFRTQGLDKGVWAWHAIRPSGVTYDGGIDQTVSLVIKERTGFDIAERYLELDPKRMRGEYDLDENDDMFSDKPNLSQRIGDSLTRYGDGILMYADDLKGSSDQDTRDYVSELKSKGGRFVAAGTAFEYRGMQAGMLEWVLIDREARAEFVNYCKEVEHWNPEEVIKGHLGLTESDDTDLFASSKRADLSKINTQSLRQLHHMSFMDKRPEYADAHKLQMARIEAELERRIRNRQVKEDDDLFAPNKSVQIYQMLVDGAEWMLSEYSEMSQQDPREYDIKFAHNRLKEVPTVVALANTFRRRGLEAGLIEWRELQNQEHSQDFSLTDWLSDLVAEQNNGESLYRLYKKVCLQRADEATITDLALMFAKDLDNL